LTTFFYEKNAKKIKKNVKNVKKRSLPGYLHASWYWWTRGASNPTRQTSTPFTYPRETEGWVDVVGWLHTGMVFLSADSHPTKYPSILTGPGVEQFCWSRCHHAAATHLTPTFQGR